MCPAEEGRRTYRPKRCGNNNKDEDNSLKNLYFIHYSSPISAFFFSFIFNYCYFYHVSNIFFSFPIIFRYISIVFHLCLSVCFFLFYWPCHLLSFRRCPPPPISLSPPSPLSLLLPSKHIFSFFSLLLFKVFELPQSSFPVDISFSSSLSLLSFSSSYNIWSSIFFSLLSSSASS